ncbi:MAG: bifunctional adenosylcobinamide kinase/adenosylcobinamide-phosphate guanylyltransferase [Bacillota bacterium]
MGKLIVITGGVRSGKSTYAEKLARDAGGPVLYIATAVPFDREMQDRIARHRERRPADWDTWEGDRNLAAVFQSLPRDYRTVLLDCVTILITNLLLQAEGAEAGNLSAAAWERIEQNIWGEIQAFLTAAAQTTAMVIMVTNEVGAGIVPENQLARVFRDIAGRINQALAVRADEVYLVVCGLPVRLK